MRYRVFTLILFMGGEIDFAGWVWRKGLGVCVRAVGLVREVWG